MHIFSIYKQGETSSEFEKYRLILDLYLEKKITIDQCIHMLLNSYEESINYLRPLVAALVLNLKSFRKIQKIDENLVDYLGAIREYLQAKFATPLFMESIVITEYLGCLNRYEKQNGRLLVSEDELKAPAKFIVPLIYKPHQSGFFSVLENIINAEIYAKKSGSELYIDLDGNWWRYSTPFEVLFPRFKYKKKFTPFIYKSLNFSKSRKWFFSQSYQAWKGYEAIKEEIYSEIYDCIEIFLQNKNIDWRLQNQNNMIGVYVRRGDKVQLEDACIEDELVIKNIAKIIQDYQVSYLCSDDNKWLQNNFKNYERNIIFDDDNSAGYFFGRESCDDDIKILIKYMRLVNVENFSGDCGSNLINAIVYTRRYFKRTPIFLNDFYSTNAIPLI